jgi:hypothetical protein
MVMTNTLTPEQMEKCREAYKEWLGTNPSYFGESWDAFQAAWSAAQAQGIHALSDDEIVKLICSAYNAGVDSGDDAALAIIRPYLHPTPPEQEQS